MSRIEHGRVGANSTTSATSSGLIMPSSSGMPSLRPVLIAKSAGNALTPATDASESKSPAPPARPARRA